MKSRRSALFILMTLAATTGLAASWAEAEAAPPKAAPPAAAPDAPSVPSVSAAVARIKCGLKPTVCAIGTGPGAVFEGFRWGQRHEEVSVLYNRPQGIFDVEYNRRLVKMQPGPEMTSLEAERDDRKRAFDASFIQFGGTPTGYDATPIKNEYTYRNKESIQSVELAGVRRYFFYIGSPPGERLWKVYDEVRLADDGALGKSFQDALTAVNQFLGVPGRVRAADPSQNIYATTVDWQDEKSRLRLVDRSR